MEKFIAGLLVVAGIAIVWLGIMWGLWALWCWAMPQVYPAGPAGLITPGYWLFFVCWTLVTTLGKAIFGGSSK